MRLVWSQPSSAQDRSRGPVPVAVACIFLGSLLAGRADETPRPFRVASASLFTTGGVLLLIGGARFALHRSKRSGTPLTLVHSEGSRESQSVSGLQEEEQL
jgi:hypothetical protein